MGFGLKALGHDLVNQPDPAPPEPSPRPIVRCRDGLVNLSAWEPYGRVMPDSKPLKVHSWLKPGTRTAQVKPVKLKMPSNRAC